MNNHNKGQDDKARANRREQIVPYCGGFPEPDAGGAMTLAPFFLSANYQGMDDELLVLRLTELRAQLAELTKRLEGLDSILADGVTDEAVKKYAEELTKIIDEREPILNEVRSLLVMTQERDGTGAMG